MYILIYVYNNIISKVNFRLSVLKEVFKFSEKRTKLILINSLVVSVFRYCCPLLIDSIVASINKLQTLLMKCTRYILGFNSYQMTIVNIMREHKLLTIHHMIPKEAMLFIHKILYNESPKILLKKFTFSLSQNIKV